MASVKESVLQARRIAVHAIVNVKRAGSHLTAAYNQGVRWPRSAMDKESLQITSVHVIRGTLASAVKQVPLTSLAPMTVVDTACVRMGSVYVRSLGCLKRTVVKLAKFAREYFPLENFAQVMGLVWKASAIVSKLALLATPLRVVLGLPSTAQCR